MVHPYKTAPDRAFWKRAFTPNWETLSLMTCDPLIKRGEKVASAGSCFAANIVPFLADAGFEYIRRDIAPLMFANVAAEHFNYGRFSAAYGNIYTARQAAQMFRRALRRFRPKEDRWVVAGNLIIDAFRPGLKFPATSDREFDLLTSQHLDNVLDAVRAADVFIFTLGLTEAWVSSIDGAVFPACPGTVAGIFDPTRHLSKNFSVAEVTQDLRELVELVREIQPRIRVVLTVSPVPLVATATGKHVLEANTYSKSVLRVAASDIATDHHDITYFPAYEIVTGPQAPFDFFGPDRREPSAAAVRSVMHAFLSKCETGTGDNDHIDSTDQDIRVDLASETKSESEVALTSEEFAMHMSAIVSNAQCEEEAAGL